MSSLFSPLSKFKARSNPSLKEQFGQLGNASADSFNSTDHKTTFSKMRRKKIPPPISISLGTGNVIVTSAPSTSGLMYTGPQWPPTPQTPHPPCTNLRCIERESGLLSLLQPPHLVGSPLLWQQQSAYLAQPSTPPHRCFPTAELPAHSPRTVELDAPLTPKRSSFEYETSGSLSSPVRLYPVTPDTFQDVDSAIHYEKDISGMDFDELIETLPELSPRQISLYWKPAMIKAASAMKRDHLNKGQGQGETNQPLAPPSTSLGDRTSGQSYRSTTESEAQLNRLKNELCCLLELHESRMDTLCGFITERHSAEVQENKDSSLRAVFEVVREQKQRILRSPRRDTIEESQQQIDELKEKVDNLQCLLAHRNEKLQSCQMECKVYKQELHAISRAERRQRRDIKEKDAQIDILNSKVTQLLNMGPSLLSSPAGAGRVEKLLPSPAYSDRENGKRPRRQPPTFSVQGQALSMPAGSCRAQNSSIPGSFCNDKGLTSSDSNTRHRRSTMT